MVVTSFDLACPIVFVVHVAIRACKTQKYAQSSVVRVNFVTLGAKCADKNSAAKNTKMV